MNKPILSLIIVGILTLTLVGCGGGDSDTNTKVITPVPASTTADLEVAPDFNFRIDMDMVLSITEVPQYAGVVNVYYDYEFHDEVNNIYYPDYATKLLSFSPSASTSVDIQVNKNWVNLIVEFVPIEAEGIQMFKKLTLSNDTTISFKFSE